MLFGPTENDRTGERLDLGKEAAMLTLSIIKADTGGFVGHSAVHPDRGPLGATDRADAEAGSAEAAGRDA